MKPIQLTMQAFGSYGKKTTIDFTKPNQNLFLITGDTGAGKTTIFDAIVFALYGEASSGSNKKDGTELQSQFVDYQITPFVELTFSERSEGAPQIYTVHRIPKHIRPLKKGTGTKEEIETVSLIMPDGTEYAQNKKETNAKLEDIVGLSKSQFMQVAMIAQGEFMELLRADSNKKREIFRKLFNTELFRDIVNVLDQRRKAKLSQMAQTRTACQTEAAHIVVPQEYEHAEELLAVKDRILNADRLNVADLEFLLEALKTMCDTLQTELQSTTEIFRQAETVRDAKRDAYNQGNALIAAFQQLENAEAELASCEASEPEIQKAAKLMQEIDSAYEIQTVSQRLADAQKAAVETAEKLKAQRLLLPSLQEAATEAAQSEAAAKTAQDEQLTSFTKVSQRVQKSLETLKMISDTTTAMEKARFALQTAQTKEVQAKKALSDFEATQLEWRKQAEALADAGVLLAQWEAKLQQAQSAQADMAALKNKQQDVDSQKEKLQAAQDAYGAIREKFLTLDAEYLAKQNAFLDAQAGFLAKEKLEPGKPCPVCGSVHHPSPCVLSEDHQNLTREMIEALAQKVETLRQEQASASNAAGSAADLLREKQSYLEDAAAKLQGQIANFLPDISGEQSMAQLEAALAQWISSLDTEGKTLRQNADTLKTVQALLRGADEKKQLLHGDAEAAAQAVSKAKLDLAANEATLAGLEAQKDYACEQDARTALDEAATAKNNSDHAYTSAHAAAGKAASEKAQAESLIAQFEGILPAQEAEREQRQNAYDTVLAEKGLSETQWKLLTDTHKKSEISMLQDRIHNHATRKAKAIGARDTARKAIEDRERPNLEQLASDFTNAEQERTEAQKRLDNLKEYYKANRSAYDALAPKMEERSRITKEFTKIDSLYSRLAGKVTGGRMDIETFVQRYYLQRILYAANARFQDMSAGQFELRICNEDQAGEGKNRGLDLMVYSTVTGKEREVRTLSGGESFMAALSLALGMADQIQENSAAINLDMMFIDEGFGSLDAHSRDQAVRVLQQMASGSKLIGIISHVTELKLAIEDQLVVTKDETGSHPHWEIS